LPTAQFYTYKMSHATTNTSEQPTDPFSWISLPTSDAFDDVDDLRRRAQNEDVRPSRSLVSRPQSQDIDDRETILRGTSSPQLAYESEVLLDTNRARSPSSAISSTTDRSSLNNTPRAVALTRTRPDHLVRVFMLTSQQ
jgi:hypothetical protein